MGPCVAFSMPSKRFVGVGIACGFSQRLKIKTLDPESLWFSPPNNVPVV